MLQQINRKAAVFFIAAGATLIVLLGLLIPSVVQATQAATPPPPGASCGGEVTYYAYQAPNAHGPGSTANFGPDLTVSNVGEAVAKFNDSMQPCKGDPLATAARTEFLAHGENMDPAVVKSEATKIANDRTAWQAKADAIRNDIVSVELVNIDENFDSLGMTLGATPKDMPTLAKFATLPHMGAALKATTREGATRFFRINCFFQPSVPPNQAFTSVPTEKVEQPAPPQPQQPQQPPQPPCTTCECLGNCVPACTTCECQGNCPIPQCTTCACTNTCLTPKGPSVNNGWTPLPSGPLTNGQQSQQQKQSGQTSGNVTDSKVPAGTTSGSTTPDLPAGTVTAPGATPAPAPAPGSSPAPKDPYAGSPGAGGTGGATCQPDPFTGAGC